MFSLIYAWTNGWVNNRDASDLRHHRTQYDVRALINCKSFMVIRKGQQWVRRIWKYAVLGIIKNYSLNYMVKSYRAWWRHQMETFTALLALCEVIPPVTGGFPSQRPVTRNFDIFFVMRLNKRLGKQAIGGWFETPSRSLLRHYNGQMKTLRYFM